MTNSRVAITRNGNGEKIKMDAFSDAEVIKLGALTAAFVIGMIVCIFVVIRESVELKRRRKAKELLYRDAVHREVERKRSQASAPASVTDAQQTNFQSFA